MKRAERRHHLRRMKAKARRIYRSKDFLFGTESWESHKKWEDRAANAADRLCSCSCQMCRNPRHSTFCKTEHLTRQERCANMKLAEEIRSLRQE